MSAQTFDNITLGMAVAAAVLRWLDKPWLSSICGCCAMISAAFGQWTDRAERRSGPRA